MTILSYDIYKKNLDVKTIALRVYLLYNIYNIYILQYSLFSKNFYKPYEKQK